MADQIFARAKKWRPIESQASTSQTGHVNRGVWGGREWRGAAGRSPPAPFVEEQLSAPGNSYASITKGAGVHVKCTDAQTQTYNVQLTSTASGGDPPPQPRQKAGGGPPPAHKTNAGDKPRPAPKPPSSLFESHKDGAAAGSSARSRPTDQKNAPKQKIDTGRVSKGSDDPIKSHNVFDVLSEEGMEAETTPASPRKGQIARLPIT